MRIVFRRAEVKTMEKEGKSSLDGKEPARSLACPNSICMALLRSIKSNNCPILSDFVGTSLIIRVL